MWGPVEMVNGQWKSKGGVERQEVEESFDHFVFYLALYPLLLLCFNLLGPWGISTGWFSRWKDS